ncbi:protein prenyltransferase alpha subunit repeat-containing protein 1-B isoform X1 [Iris pallida]|uniref:Protein prenyltransferase alpha subunit repeat-containing protein 1-B isoform X1 n=1 Tax=Iris pallida TaxID=29817 RepID=A0AAX6FGK6_IRIPA|nr:protein prenyltransferase alpha subunit repeat-containing protein 1-B isoform X1 [Iris pallida]
MGWNLLDQLELILEHDKLIKLVLSRKHDLSLFMEELQLCALTLSYAPKSESSWRHRRWVIKMIAENFQNLQEIVEEESQLVKNIAEKSKMNYRAWNNRCWLVCYMTRSQVLDQLKKSRKWAELHVADNCCFHYRRRLILRMLEGNFVKQDEESSYLLLFRPGWKEELQWNELLIKQYMGREALWVHRRFLAQCWIKHFAALRQELSPHLEAENGVNSGLNDFLDEELQLLHACLNTPADGFDDSPDQAQYAASYILYISKQIHLLGKYKLQERLKEVGDLKALLRKTCPEKLLLWESLSD